MQRAAVAKAIDTCANTWVVRTFDCRREPAPHHGTQLRECTLDNTVVMTIITFPADVIVHPGALEARSSSSLRKQFGANLLRLLV
eukprot:6197689-Pleurochrysis_carterae.AAC.1